MTCSGDHDEPYEIGYFFLKLQFNFPQIPFFPIFIPFTVFSLVRHMDSRLQVALALIYTFPIDMMTLLS